VSIRGDPNVVILIDGQPSGMLRGPGRGGALQQLPAGQYERVEVITTPSAAYGPEGTGGIINLIPKRVRRPGLSGSARVNVSTRGRANASLSAAYSNGPTTFSGDIAARRDELSGTSDRTRERLDPNTGNFSALRQEGNSVTRTGSGSVKARIERGFGKETRASVDLTRARSRSEAGTRETYQADGFPVHSELPRERKARSGLDLDNTELRGRVTRQFGRSEHKLTIDLSRQLSDTDRVLRSDFLFDPGVSTRVEEFQFDVTQRLTQLKIDYLRPVGDGSKLQLGLEGERQHNSYDNEGALGFGGQALAPLPAFTNRFVHDQSVGALYGTFEHPLGRLTALAGLRVEQVRLKLNQLTLDERFSRSYSRAYPSLHLSYKLDEQEQLRASYSRRVQRPQGQDLNPFLEYRDPLNLRAGNPRLQPQETQALELSWQRRVKANFYQATVYHRSTRKAFTDVVEDLGGGILLTTRQNLDNSRATGLELIANRKLSPTVSLNASANLSRIEINSANLGFPENRSGTQFGGRGSLNWQPTDKDNLQISGFLSGKSLRPPGYRAPSGMINLGYRHKFNDRLSFVATVRDVLGNFGEAIVYETPAFRDRVERRFGGRVVFVGLTYTLAAATRERRDPAFDFEAGTTQ
jgi:outer membrane receptor protein involved in Fe transport